MTPDDQAAVIDCAAELRAWLDVCGIDYRQAAADPTFLRIPCPGGRIQLGVHRGPEVWIDVSTVIK